MTSRNTPRYEEERVTSIPDPSFPGRYQPQVSSAGHIRTFDPEDILRVMDFDIASEPPQDGPLMLGEDVLNGDAIRFPIYHFCMRGGYLFYFEPDDVDHESAGRATFHGPPVGAVPLEHVQVTFPPGGRRVFREHAHTDARTGYELVVLHTPNEDTEVRPPVFLVTQSLGQREKWAQALRERASVSKPTLLRAGFTSTSATTSTNGRASAASNNNIKRVDESTSKAMIKDNAQQLSISATTSMKDDAGVDLQKEGATSTKESLAKASARGGSSKKQSLFSSSKQQRTTQHQQQQYDASDDIEVVQAISEFAAPNFLETEWLDNFLQIHGDFETNNKCQAMEQIQAEMKKSLKGAVLEQYEYFVQASGEMTTMGREVTALKQLIETQVETIREMKEIDFSGALATYELDYTQVSDGHVLDEHDGSENNSLFNHGTDKETKLADALFDDVFDELEKNREASTQKTLDETVTVDDAPPIDIPNWLDDVTDEIGALVREARYNDAIDLQVKAKAEVLDLVDRHERPTPYRLSQQQVLDLHRLRRTLDVMARRIGNRLEETLRRKNEALRQASKRERTDPNATVTVVSPCALDDDALYLQLLVKVGRNQTAAEQYAARRSLLLLEALNERPISGAGSVDLVIYAAQLSQSFFSCLALSVEGFLDLFMDSSTSMYKASSDDKGHDLDTDSIAGSSLHSHTTKTAPAGAVASVVLWCDSELSKFASAFGGARILANLALSPPPRDGARKPRVVGEEDGGSKDRRHAIDIAAQCIDKAFMYATQNLDSVGLPLAPRLAEYIRQRLKGCEEEVAELLDDKWSRLIVDWRIPNGSNGSIPNGDH
ncbi:hypothetical protein MPSEU_000652300 [Mayamaea pseudoterrestris]|nr:hypothetical protein MPSEU_000652300 [Mayamaea pseudoterrestris]